AILERHPVAKPLHLPALSRQLGRGESEVDREGILPRHRKDSRRLCQPALPRSRQRSERLSALIACDEKVERRGGILEDVGIGELRDDIGRTLKPWIVGAERKALWCGERNDKIAKKRIQVPYIRRNFYGNRRGKAAKIELQLIVVGSRRR